MRKLKQFLALVLLFLFFVAGYFGSQIVDARKRTPEIIQNARSKYGEDLQVADLSSRQLDILLQVEDPNFYTHNGIDVKTKGAGITTITQGMVKYLYFDDFKPGIAKLRQSLIAVFALDALVSKGDQLTLFLNSVYMGTSEGKEIRGLHNASTHYFDKQFSEISEEEYVQLVAMIIGPNGYNPQNNPDKLAIRVNRIKNLLDEKCEPEGNRDVLYRNCD